MSQLVSNGLGALSWVSVEFPVTFISETLGGINVFGTKVPPRDQLVADRVTTS